MAADNKTADWELRDHIQALKNVPSLVGNCAAARPVSEAMIFFGRQLGDLKVEVSEIPDDVLKQLEAMFSQWKVEINTEMLNQQANGTNINVAAPSGLASWSRILGVPPLYLLIGYLIAKAHGWIG